MQIPFQRSVIIYKISSRKGSFHKQAFSYQGRQSVLKSEGDRLENEEVRGHMLP